MLAIFYSAWKGENPEVFEWFSFSDIIFVYLIVYRFFNACYSYIFSNSLLCMQIPLKKLKHFSHTIKLARGGLKKRGTHEKVATLEKKGFKTHWQNPKWCWDWYAFLNFWLNQIFFENTKYQYEASWGQRVYFEFFSICEEKSWRSLKKSYS